MAANISRRGTTVLTKEQIEFEIASERKFIERQRQAQIRMSTQNSGVRSGTISADLAAFDISIWNAEARIAEHEEQLKELQK